jgi:hypothetical protein
LPEAPKIENRRQDLAGESNIAPELSTAIADAMLKLFFDNQQSKASAQPSVPSPKRVYAPVSKGAAHELALALNAHG